MFVPPPVVAVLRFGFITTAVLRSLCSKYAELLFLSDAGARRNNSAQSRCCTAILHTFEWTHKIFWVLLYSRAAPQTQTVDVDGLSRHTAQPLEFRGNYTCTTQSGPPSFLFLSAHSHLHDLNCKATQVMDTPTQRYNAGGGVGNSRRLRLRL